MTLLTEGPTSSGQTAEVVAIVLAEGSGIYVWDQAGRERVVLIVAADGSQVLGFRDKDGKVIWKAP